MDFFKRIAQPPKFDVPVIEKRDHVNKGRPVSEETRAKISAGHKGRPRSLEWRAKISSAMPNKKACKTPLGVFKSVAAAARAHNLCETTVKGHLIGSVRSDWHFVEETE